MKSWKYAQIACLILGLCILLPSCGKQEQAADMSSSEEQSETVKEQETGKNEAEKTTGNGPDQSLLEADLQGILDTDPRELTLSSFEVTKSLTEDHNYSADIDVIADGQYGEFQALVSVTYTKYDQGWAIDDYSLEFGDWWQIVNYPTEETIAGWIEEGKESSLEGERTFIGMTIDNDTTVSYESCIPEILGNHVSQSVNITSTWIYIPGMDEWITMNICYEYSTPVLTGVEGEWPTKYGGSIIISNVRNDGFDVCDTIHNSGTVHVTYNPGNNTYVGEGANYEVGGAMPGTNLPIYVSFSYDSDTNSNVVWVDIEGSMSVFSNATIP